MLDYDQAVLRATRYFKQWRDQGQRREQADLRAVSPMTYASKIKIPILIGHGEKTTTTSPSPKPRHGRALTAANAKVKSVFYPEAVTVSAEPRT